MIVATPALFAIWPPRTIVTMGHLFRIRFLGFGDELIEIQFEQPEVCGVFIDPVAQRFKVVARCYYVHIFRLNTLNFTEQRGVHTELQYCLCIGLPGKVWYRILRTTNRRERLVH